MANREQVEQRIAWHYARGVPLAAVGFFVFFLSILKTAVPNPFVGGFCREILRLVPGIEMYYRFIPSIDHSWGAFHLTKDAVAILFFLGMTIWGAWELEEARKIRNARLRAEDQAFDDAMKRAPR